MVDFDKIEAQKKNKISAIPIQKINQKKNSPTKQINNSYMAKPVKSNRSFKFGAKSRDSNDNFLDALGIKKKPKNSKEKKIKSGSMNNSFRLKPNELLGLIQS